MNRILPNLVTVVIAGIVSFAVTRWTSHAAPSSPVSGQASQPIPVPRLSNADGQPLAPRPFLHEEKKTAVARVDQIADTQRVANFRRGLEDRFASAPRNAAWAHDYEERIRAELLRSRDEFPETAEANVTCGLGICEMTLSHTDAGSAQRFHNALLSGKFINSPELLNQENGCNLHAFSSDGIPIHDTFYIECREGRR